MESYINNIVKIADLHNATVAHTPMSHTQLILEPMAKNDNFLFIALLSCIFWVARCCRPDILFATALLVHFSNCFRVPHINMLKHIFRYLANTAPISITYDSNKPFYEVTHTPMPTLLLNMAEN
jgi:hypothetical protein